MIGTSGYWTMSPAYFVVVVGRNHQGNSEFTAPDGVADERAGLRILAEYMGFDM